MMMLMPFAMANCSVCELFISKNVCNYKIWPTAEISVCLHNNWQQKQYDTLLNGVI